MKHIRKLTAIKADVTQDEVSVLETVFQFVLDYVESTNKDKSGSD